MNEIEKILVEAVREDHPYIVSLRRYFHQHPELAAQEFLTQEKIEAELDKIGVPHERTAGTGVYARIEGKAPGRTIVLRADIDALPVQEESDIPYRSLIPGKMHACGHDGHTAALLGAARVLAAHRDLFRGTVVLTFQPGEEVGYGARIIVEEGRLEGADRTFGLHVSSKVPCGKVVVMAGPNNASVDMFRIKVHGLGAHVSTPERGVDAAYIISQIVVGAQALVTRRVSPMENALIGIGKITAGTAYNVVAQEAELEGTIRVFLPQLREQIRRELKNLAEATAAMYQGTCEVEYRDFTSALINDEQAAKEAQKVVSSLFGEENLIRNRQPDLAGDDFAEYILKVPGVYAYIGSGNKKDPHTTLAHHHSQFDIDEDCLGIGAALYAAYAADYLNGEG